MTENRKQPMTLKRDVKEKRSIRPGTLLNPVPAVMVSCGSDRPNIITIAWTGIINSDPPMTYISVRPSRHSYEIIDREGEFVINLTTEGLAFATDFCGVRSGREVDKFEAMHLTPIPGDIVRCPMIAESPINLECVVREKHHYGSHDMFVAEIVSVHVDASLMEPRGRIDFAKADLMAYVHGEYFRLNRKPIGRFGYSVMKPKTRKRLNREKFSNQRNDKHRKKH